MVMRRTRHSFYATLAAALIAMAAAGTFVHTQGQPPAGQAGAPAAPGGFPGGGGRGPAPGWATPRGDAQRTGWVRADAYLTVDGLKKGFDVQWTVQIGRTAGERFAEGVSGNTVQLNPAPGDIAGSANNV